MSHTNNDDQISNVFTNVSHVSNDVSFSDQLSTTASSSEDEDKHEEERPINFSYGLTNARSLWQKRHCLYEYMKELDLAFTIVTESWFYECEALKTIESDAANGHAISLINKCRVKRSSSNPGGGVCIAFQRGRISLKEYKVKRKTFEILCARGKLVNNTRPLVIVAVYIPPKSTAKQSADCLECVSDAVLKIKTDVQESYIIVGGDLNGRDLAGALGDYNDVAILDAPPSRASAKLDVSACNFGASHVRTEIRDPLETEDGQSRSDHAFLSYHFTLIHRHSCLLYTSPSPRDRQKSRMPSSA